MLKQLSIGLAALGMVAALTGCGAADTKPAGNTPAPAPAASDKPAPGNSGSSGGTVVELKNTKFAQEKIEVTAGTTVKWVNKDNVDHSVWEGVPDSGQHGFKSSDFSTDGEFTHTFDKPGTYEIFCNTASHHLLGMKMQVVVK
ncbi:MAG TPA: plastocyanin/azurin family copper-binding protein [Symbiobacteriaceae bacterium]|nr:plastocyanin/azurin family copper-binding protein [Symbiobacteriaceae bacterium]